jgi:hypothetical protein
MRVPPDFIYMLPPGGTFLVILAVVGAVALAVYSVFRLPRIRAAAPRLSHINTAVGSVSGAIFGLSMTFLANAVWSIEDKARETVNAEARAIRVMEVYMDSMTGPARDGIARLLADYGEAVSAEWDAMGQEGAGVAAEQALREIYAAIIKGFAEGEQNRALQQRLLTALDSLSTARQQRLSLAQNFVSGSQWTLVTGLALVLLVVIAASHADFPLASAVSVAALAAAISVLLFVIILHDRPFIGYAALTPEPILRATGAGP